MTTLSEDLSSVVSLADIEALARERMEPAAWDHLAGGAGTPTLADVRREHVLDG